MAAILPHLKSVVDQDGAVILDIPRNTMTILNPTGAYVWQRLKQGKAIDSIVADLALEAGMDIVAVAADVEAFMADLKSKHLLLSVS